MAVNLDRISLLPIELLLTIFSVLPFKEAVRTSVLSRQWLNIFKSTPNIEFDEHFFVKPDQSDETREAQRRAFLEFIKFWIENYKGTMVEKFSLRLSMPANAGEIIDGCVSFATQRGVKELELDFSEANRNYNDVHIEDYEGQLELPIQVYEHRRLESLKLCSCRFIGIQVLNFHALKEVSLGWMEVRFTEIQALLSNCKNLECLSFKRCWNFDEFDLGEEKHMGLRKLVLDKCRFVFDFFSILAPNLKIFKYCGRMDFGLTVFDSLVMEEADLDFSLECSFQGFGSPVHNLVEDFSIVRVLTVCSFVLQVIPSGPEHLRLIYDMNVRHLIMKMALHENEFFGIAFFLNSCRILERLTIELGSLNYLSDYEPPFYCDRTEFWNEYLEVFECLRSTLEVVEINGFRGTVNECLALQYFICHGFVLKRININMLKDDSGRTVECDCLQMAETLLTIPRASRNLEISIF